MPLRTTSPCLIRKRGRFHIAPSASFRRLFPGVGGIVDAKGQDLDAIPVQLYMLRYRMVRPQGRSENESELILTDHIADRVLAACLGTAYARD
jgi:hypothetical protein